MSALCCGAIWRSIGKVRRIVIGALRKHASAPLPAAAAHNEVAPKRQWRVHYLAHRWHFGFVRPQRMFFLVCSLMCAVPFMFAKHVAHFNFCRSAICLSTAFRFRCLLPLCSQALQSLDVCFSSSLSLKRSAVCFRSHPTHMKTTCREHVLQNVALVPWIVHPDSMSELPESCLKSPGELVASSRNLYRRALGTAPGAGAKQMRRTCNMRSKSFFEPRDIVLCVCWGEPTVGNRFFIPRAKLAVRSPQPPPRTGLPRSVSSLFSSLRPEMRNCRHSCFSYCFLIVFRIAA